LTGAAIAFVAVRWISAGYLGWLARRDLKLSIRALFTPTREDVTLLRDAISTLRGRLRIP
jgi:threonine/homoserine/homoserine lactone efflux protein